MKNMNISRKSKLAKSNNFVVLATHEDEIVDENNKVFGILYYPYTTNT